MFQRAVHRNKYKSAIGLIDEEYSRLKQEESNNVLKINAKTEEINKLKSRINDLFLDKETWLEHMTQLYTLDKDAAQECISDFCSSYAESPIDSLKNVITWIALSNTFDFLSRCKCVESLWSLKLLHQVLKQYMQNPSDDINFTMYSDYLVKLFNEKWIPVGELEKMICFVFSAKFVSWATKYNLWKYLVASTSLANSLKSVCGKLLLNSNPLSSYTVLSMQIFTFDNLTLGAILKRCKSLSDAKVKADVLDHLLQYPATLKGANEMLKDLGEGMKTLDSSQNVHMVSVDIDNWLQHLSTSVLLGTSVLDEILGELREMWKDHTQFEDINSALRRIELDNTVYGKTYFKLAGVLHRVVLKIRGQNDSEVLMERLREELIEMSNTCSTGHLVRLMNVFSGFDENNFISVDPRVELKSVLHKRVEMWMDVLKTAYDEDFVKVEGRQTLTLRPDFNKEEERKMPEDSETIYDKILDAWSSGDEMVFQKYVYAKLPEIREELHKEYVGQKLLDDDAFEETYRTCIQQLVVGL